MKTILLLLCFCCLCVAACSNAVGPDIIKIEVQPLDPSDHWADKRVQQDSTGATGARQLHSTDRK